MIIKKIYRDYTMGKWISSNNVIINGIFFWNIIISLERKKWRNWILITNRKNKNFSIENILKMDFLMIKLNKKNN